MLKNIEKETFTAFTKTDVFFVDANVLVYLYGPPTEKTKRKAAAYSDFIQQLKRVGCNLCVSALNAQEVFHVIEKIYCAIHRENNGGPNTVKQYRKIPAERIALANRQQKIWCELQEFYDITQEDINRCDLNAFIEHYANHHYEPIDYIVTSHHKPVNIITDDRDFEKDGDVVAYTFLHNQL